MKPETRARTSTEATASKRPENSSHWVTRLATGAATLTGMAGGPPWARAAADVRTKERLGTANKRRQTGKKNSPADILRRGTCGCAMRQCQLLAAVTD